MVNYRLAIATFIVVCGIWLNFYKFQVMYENFVDKTSYKLYPWQEDPILSKSKPIWLILHLTSSLFQIIVTTMVIFTDKEELKVIHRKGHYVFALILIYNLNVFANLNTIPSIVSNGIPLILSFVALYSKKHQSNFIYLLCLSPPIFLEFILKTLFLMG